MLKGIGIDVVYLDVMKTMVEARSGEALRDIFTDAEIDLCQSSPNMVERFATRFAAKEAVAKALGCGIGAVGWQSIEIQRGAQGEPVLVLYDKASAMAHALGLHTWSISISHSRTYAVAVAVALKLP